MTFEERLQGIVDDCSKKDWNSYGADPVRAEAVAMSRLIAPGVPESEREYIVPNVEGGITWEWDDALGGTYFVEVTYVPPSKP